MVYGKWTKQEVGCGNSEEKVHWKQMSGETCGQGVKTTRCETFQNLLLWKVR